MKLIGYYAFHAFINQIKKLMHSWFVIFLVACMLLGGFAGLGVGMLAEKTEQESSTSVSTEVAEPEETEEESEEVLPGFSMKDFVGELPKEEIPKLAAALAILGLLLFSLAKAETSPGKLFLPADASLLFASPLKPQSVLIFRIMMGLGTMLFFVIYFFFVTAVDGNLFGLKKVFYALTILLTICAETILQSTLFVACSTHKKLGKTLTYIAIAIAGLVLAGFLLFLRMNEGRYERLAALSAYLNYPGTNLVPVWGWLKAITIHASQENYGYAGLYSLLTLAGLAGMIWILYNLKADFYEEAMKQAEITAVRMEKAKEGRAGIAFAPKKHKERKESSEDTIKGFGASVFLYKAIRKRREGAGRGFLTKTTVLYLAAALVAYMAGSRLWDFEPVLPALGVLAVLVFYRSLGNPLNEDLNMSYYSMIPENRWKKFFFSTIGGTLNSILDLLPALLVLVILSPENWLMILLGSGLLISMDLYATITAAFIDNLIPKNLDKMPRQIIQVMFIYFGLVPDGIVVIAFALMDMTKWIMPLCLVVNLILAGVFFLMTPMLLEPTGSAAPKPDLKAFLEAGGDLKTAARTFSRAGLILFFLLVATVGVQIGASLLVDAVYPAASQTTAGIWLVNMLPMYIITMPLAIWLLRKLAEKEDALAGVKIENRTLGILNFFSSFAICIFMMVSGSVIGTLLNTGFAGIFGIHTSETAAQQLLLADGEIWKVLIVVILAPIYEEFIFRKGLVDNMRRYGDVTAIVTSAVMFGLFHGNFSQMFYAFGIGLVLAAVYIKTGRLRYTIAMHMSINFLGGIAAPKLLELMTEESADVSEVVRYGFIIYMVLYLATAVIGLILLVYRASSISFKREPRELPYGKVGRVVWLNIGMIAFLLLCILAVADSIYGMSLR